MFPFFAIPALSAASPLIVIPALTHTYGASGWAAIAIGQSIGMAASAINDLGWGVLGPQRIAGSSDVERLSIYRAAFAAKLATFLILFFPVIFLALYLAPQYKAASAILAIAICAGSLSPAWFFIGCNKPRQILLLESVPRMLLLIVAGVAIYFGSSLIVYGMALLVAVLATAFFFVLVFGRAAIPEYEDLQRGLEETKRQWSITLGRTVSVIYTALPIVLVSVVNPNAVVGFSAVDRLMRMALSILSGVPSRLQSWVGSVKASETRGRSRQSLLYNFYFGLASGAVFFIAAPIAAPHIFSNAITISYVDSSLAALIIVAICTSRGYGLSLVAERKSNLLIWVNVGSAAIGILSILILPRFFGIVGALLSVLAAEIFGLLIQIYFLHILKSIDYSTPQKS